MKALSYYLLACLLLTGFEVFSQTNNTTRVLKYDYKEGKLYNGDETVNPKKKKNYEIPGIKERQTVSLKVVNINPLKYFCEFNGKPGSINEAPPAFTAPVALNSLEAPTLPVPETSADGMFGKVLPKGRYPFSDNKDCSAKALEIKNQISTMLSAYESIKRIQSEVRSLGIIFNSYDNYIKQATEAPALTKEEFNTRLNSLVTSTLIQRPAMNVYQTADVNLQNMKAYQESLMIEYKTQEKLFNDTYADLYDAVLQYKKDVQCLIKKYYNNTASSKDLSFELLLANLPASKKEVLKLQEWIRAGQATLDEKLWPAILSSITSFEKMQQLQFEYVSAPIPMQEDLLALNLVIKTKSDKAEVKKIENIIVPRIGGIHVDYGVGLYITGLGDDEYKTGSRETIVKKAFINEQQGLDSSYQSVTYSTISRSSKMKTNWGIMAYIQGKSNWDCVLNGGIYFGLGMLANNESKPIASIGASLIIGRRQQLSLHFGIAYGKVQRLNPNYEPGKEYEGQITEPTVNVMEKGFLGGICWKLGAIKFKN